jgi:hypothetical protein
MSLVRASPGLTRGDRGIESLEDDLVGIEGVDDFEGDSIRQVNRPTAEPSSSNRHPQLGAPQKHELGTRHRLGEAWTAFPFPLDRGQEF